MQPFLSKARELEEELLHSPSGLELRELGFEEDARIAAALNVSESVPILADGAFTAMSMKT